MLKKHRKELKVTYDKYYKTENLFREPYPELIKFFANCLKKGKVLDLGCGQGRDAIAISRLGYKVVGIDNSRVGIGQMIEIAKKENLDLEGKVADIHEFKDFQEFDFVLFDSMFHFYKKDRERETGFIKKTIENVKNGGLIIFCVPDTMKIVGTLNETIDFNQNLERIEDTQFKYFYDDEERGKKTEMDYRMIVVKK